MPDGVLNIAAIVAALVSAASAVYCLLSCALELKFTFRRKNDISSPSAFPGVSILKPLKGDDPEMYGALRSHCVQHYPDYEILFGIADRRDSAIPLIEKLKQEFPDCTIRVVNCDQRLGANGKVSSLAHLTKAARHELLIVNDGDIRVGPDYLRNVIGELERPGTGLVTCLYRGAPAATLGSKLEALGITTDFIPGVLVAQFIERGLHFGLGSTLAFRKCDLEAIGGFESLVDHLADDYELGRRIAERNLSVELSGEVVETHLPAYSIGGFFSHQLRWARTIRASRPLGYAGLLFTFTLPWATATLLLARSARWAWALFAAAFACRLAMAVAGAVLRDRNSVSFLWLVPIRDFIAPLVWIIGLVGRRIVWRGEIFELRGGKLRGPADP